MSKDTVENTDNNQELDEAQVLDSIKTAHFKGWTNQFIAAGKSFDEAKEAYDRNNEAADKVMEKYASIHETIKNSIEEKSDKE